MGPKRKNAQKKRKPRNADNAVNIQEGEGSGEREGSATDDAERQVSFRDQLVHSLLCLLQLDRIGWNLHR